jgi:hypothetical protein
MGAASPMTSHCYRKRLLTHAKDGTRCLPSHLCCTWSKAHRPSRSNNQDDPLGNSTFVEWPSVEGIGDLKATKDKSLEELRSLSRLGTPNEGEAEAVRSFSTLTLAEATHKDHLKRI